MKPGSYCKPRDRKECRAILDLAASLGLCQFRDNLLDLYPVIAVYADKLGRHQVYSCESLIGEYLSVPDFISSLYEQAKKNNGERVIGPHETFDYKDRIEALERESSYGNKWLKRVEPLERLVWGLVTRIENLEKALNDHMVKERTAVYGPDEGALVARMQERSRELTEHRNRMRAAAEQGCGYTPPASPSERLKAVHKGPDYFTSFDPKASPKDIPFEVALMFAKAGRDIRNDIVGARLTKKPWGTEMYPAVWTIASILSENWFVIPESTDPTAATPPTVNA
jgi:hypothetical protein